MIEGLVVNRALATWALLAFGISSSALADEREASDAGSDGAGSAGAGGVSEQEALRRRVEQLEGRLAASESRTEAPPAEHERRSPFEFAFHDFGPNQNETGFTAPSMCL